MKKCEQRKLQEKVSTKSLRTQVVEEGEVFVRAEVEGLVLSGIQVLDTQ